MRFETVFGALGVALLADVLSLAFVVAVYILLPSTGVSFWAAVLEVGAMAIYAVMVLTWAIAASQEKRRSREDEHFEGKR